MPQGFGIYEKAGVDGANDAVDKNYLLSRMSRMMILARIQFEDL
jgi:hypothetical protein